MVITQSNKIVTFKSLKETPITNLNINLPTLQTGSGDPLPTNKRDFIPYTGTTLVHTHKNMFDMDYFNKSDETYTVSVSNGIASGTIRSFYEFFTKTSTFCPPCIHKYTKQNLTFTITAYTDGNATTEGKGLYFLIYYSTGDRGEIYWENNCTTPTTKTISTDPTRVLAFVDITFSTGADNIWHIKDFQIEQGQNATSFEAYNPQIYTYDWSQTAGQIFRGYINPITGDLTVTHLLYHPTEYYFVSTSEQRTVCAFAAPGGYKGWDKDLNSNLATPSGSVIPPSGVLNTLNYWHEAYSYPYNLVYGSYDDYSSATEMAEYLLANGYEFTFKLATPNVYHLTSAQINAFKDRNNFFTTDQKDIDVSYDLIEATCMKTIRNRVISYNSYIASSQIIPSSYTQCDWLLTSGHNARIDTGVSGDDVTLQMKGAFMPISLVNSYTGVIGNYKTETDTYCWRIINYANTSSYFNQRFYVNMGNHAPSGTNGGSWGAAPCGTNSVINHKITFDMSYGKCTMTGTQTITYTHTTLNTGVNTTNMAIGASRPSATGGTSQYRLYEFKFYSQGKLIRYYKPCVRNSDNIAGFYDVVNQTFNPSIGSVQFVAGYDT